MDNNSANKGSAGSPDPSNGWVQLHEVVRLFQHTLLQTGAALLPIGVYFFFDQGKEVLSMLGESMSLSSPAILSAILFLLGSVLAGFTNWWTARMMLEFDLGDTVEHRGWLGGVRTWLQKYWPRVLGVAPVGVVAAALFFRIFDYKNAGSVPARWSLFWLGLWHLVGAAVLLWYFIARRNRVGDTTSKFQNFADRDGRSRESRLTNVALLALSAITLLALWAAPQLIAVTFGTGAMLSLAAVAWVTVGTRLMFFRARRGVPVITFLVAWVFLNSCWMDNHKIRLSKGEHPLNAGPTVRAAFDTWRGGVNTNSPTPSQNGVRPVFIVATEGGGIRAAYWTASVLGAFQANSVRQNPSTTDKGAPPDFASHLFAISGVSGGSVGATVFDALIADGDPTVWQNAQEILGRDHLAPLMGGLLFPDALQRVIPISLPCTDRAAMLEKSWEQAYRQVAKTDRLAQPFRDLFDPASSHRANPHLPHLLLNGTMVETGQRVIFSDLAITSGDNGGEFLDAVDARAVVFKKADGHVTPWDSPLSTAAHASARFTYTNPAALLTTGQRVVDGGYFENSGSITALEVLRVVEDQIPKGQNQTSTSSGARIVPVVIIISNDPQRRQDEKRVVWVSPQQTESEMKLQQTSVAVTPEAKQQEAQRDNADFSKTRPQQFASELLSPPKALMATREARGTLALREIIRHQDLAKQALDAAHVETPPLLISIHLHDDGIPLPLGWSLSHAAAGDMQKQLWTDEDLLKAEAAVQDWLKLVAHQ